MPTHEEKMLKVKYHHLKPEDLISLYTAGDVLRFVQKEINYLNSKICLFVDHDIRKLTWQDQVDCYEVLLKSLREMIL